MAATVISIDRDKTYLGDGLFAEYDGWQIKLYASDGIQETNTVYLEPQVLRAFEAYISKLKASVTA